VACVYNLQVAAALFLEEENLVHAEHFISKLAHLSDIFLEVQYIGPKYARERYYHHHSD
jgi:hypothetical protein